MDENSTHCMSWQVMFQKYSLAGRKKKKVTEWIKLQLLVYE